MRRKDKEIVSRAECDAVLNEAQVAHVAMVDGEKPYVVAMNFSYDGRALYLHCAKEGRKLEILARNPNVCIGAETGVRFVAGRSGLQKHDALPERNRHRRGDSRRGP